MIWNGEKINQITFLTPWPKVPLVGGAGVKVQSRRPFKNNMFLFVFWFSWGDGKKEERAWIENEKKTKLGNLQASH